MTRDGQVVEEGQASITLETGLRGIVRRPYPTAPGYVEIELDPQRVEELVGPPVAGPGPAHRQRWSLAGQIRFCLLADYRSASVLTVAELSSASGVPELVIEAIEADEEEATDRDMRLLCNALGADPDEVWPWTIIDGVPVAEQPSEPSPSVSMPPPRPSAASRLEAQEVAEQRQRDARLAEIGDVRRDLDRVTLRQGIERFKQKLRR
jgi:hypothetical protein